MKKGFTLIELLVVVLIIGILAAVALPMYTGAVERTRLTEGLSTFYAIEKSFQRFMLEDKVPSGSLWGAKLFEALDITFSDGKFDPKRASAYCTKNFCYEISCTAAGTCSMTAERHKGEPYAETATYRLLNTVGADGTTNRRCAILKSSMAGTKICAYLKKQQGWK